jgi:hypothetical protein
MSALVLLPAADIRNTMSKTFELIASSILTIVQSKQNKRPEAGAWVVKLAVPEVWYTYHEEAVEACIKDALPMGYDADFLWDDLKPDEIVDETYPEGLSVQDDIILTATVFVEKE